MKEVGNGWMGGDALICSSRFDICPTPLSSLTQHSLLSFFFSFLFYIATFSFQPIFLSLKVYLFISISISIFLVIFFSFFSTPFLALPTHTPTHSGMLIISISISHPAKLLNLYLTNKWLLGLRKVHVFISSVDSLFLLQ